MNDGKRKGAQKHKNKTAFKIVFDTQALDQQKKVSLKNLCIRCTDVMQWKLTYNKYKKMTEPVRCKLCLQKNVFRTYMKACQTCVQAKNACAKCLEVDYQAPSEVKLIEKDIKKLQKQEHHSQIQFMKTLQERSRRTIRRGLEKGKLSWDSQLAYFVDQEGNKITNLKFRKGFTIGQQNENSCLDEESVGDDDYDLFGDDQDQQDDDNKQASQNKQKSIKKSANAKPTQNSADQNQATKQVEQKVEGQQKAQHESDVEGDEVDCQDDEDCQNDDDFQDDQDFQDEDQEQQAPKKSKNAKK